MNEKLPVSVKSLLSWSEKIIHDSGNGDWRLKEFILQFSIREYCRFYDELMPHIHALKSIDEEMFAAQADSFEINRKVMEKAMKERVSWAWLGETYMSTFFRGRSADDLIAAIKDIRSNIGNIHYSITIYTS